MELWKTQKGRDFTVLVLALLTLLALAVFNPFQLRERIREVFYRAPLTDAQRERGWMK